MDRHQADGHQSQTVTVSLPCKAGLLGYHPGTAPQIHSPQSLRKIHTIKVKRLPFAFQRQSKDTKETRLGHELVHRSVWSSAARFPSPPCVG